MAQTTEKENALSSAPLRLQIMSDIHLEFKSGFDVTPKADYLVLAGDIGQPKDESYKEFLLQMAEKFKKVFVIAGNHEFYTTCYQRTKERINKVCALHPNLEFLDCTAVDIEGVRILGCTLWSHVPARDVNRVFRGLNDYRMITVAKGGKHPRIQCEDTNSWHAKERKWLEEELKKAQKQKMPVIVITHHAPSYHRTSAPRFEEGNAIMTAFATPLEAMMGDPVRVWIFGHTHFSSDQTIQGTRVVANQRGYYFEQGTGFDPLMVVEVERNKESKALAIEAAFVEKEKKEEKETEK